MQRYLTEFIGAFFLVLTIGLTVVGHTPFAPLAIGLSLMIMVYMGGSVSGGHYNPAVSTAALLAGALEGRHYVPYVVFQIAGAIVAALATRVITGETFAPVPAPAATALQALLVELLFTFALCLVVLNTAVTKRTQGNSYFGLAIGMTVTVGAFAGGGISGGAFNPAVGLGPNLVRSMTGGGSMAHVWLYLVGPLLGAVLAAAVYRIQETTKA